MTAAANDNGSAIDLRLGRWQEALADVGEVDCLVSDPPYSPRVHDGQRTGTETAKSTLAYEGISEQWCHEFVAGWANRVRHWAAVFSDHTGSHWWEAAWEAAGWYVFAPVIWLRTNATPRVAGDGPTSAVDYITVARPRRRLAPGRGGSRPGYYPTVQSAATVVMPGGKQLGPMRSLVRDYSRPGDLICDPCAGGATTLLAAAIEGRRGIGSEMDAATFAKAQARIARGYTPVMRFGDADRPAPEQQDLLVVER